MRRPMTSFRIAIVGALVALSAAACSGSDDSASGSTTAAPTVAPAGLASQVPAPDGVVYVSESPIGTTGYWTNYTVTDDGGFSLDDVASVLDIQGWTVGDQSASALDATMSGGWIDVLVVDAGTGTDAGTNVSVCVWNVAPDADGCADFPASLSESTPPATDG